MGVEMMIVILTESPTQSGPASRYRGRNPYIVGAKSAGTVDLIMHFQSQKRILQSPRKSFQSLDS